MEYKTERIYPHGASNGLLIQRLTEALGVNKVGGVKTELDGRIVIILTDEATPSDMNTAIQIVNNHDFDTLLDEEINERQALETFKQSIAALKNEDDVDLKALANAVTYLAEKIK